MSDVICRKCHKGSYEWIEPQEGEQENRKMKCNECGFVDTMDDFYEAYRHPKVDWEGRRYTLTKSSPGQRTCEGCIFIGKGYPCPAYCKTVTQKPSPFEDCMRHANTVWKETK